MTASNIGKKGYKYSFKVHPGDGTVPVLEVEFLEDHSKIQVSFEGEVIGVATVDYEKDRYILEIANKPGQRFSCIAIRPFAIGGIYREWAGLETPQIGY